MVEQLNNSNVIHPHHSSFNETYEALIYENKLEMVNFIRTNFTITINES